MPATTGTHTVPVRSNHSFAYSRPCRPLSCVRSAGTNTTVTPRHVEASLTACEFLRRRRSRWRTSEPRNGFRPWRASRRGSVETPPSAFLHAAEGVERLRNALRPAPESRSRRQGTRGGRIPLGLSFRARGVLQVVRD